MIIIITIIFSGLRIFIGLRPLRTKNKQEKREAKIIIAAVALRHKKVLYSALQSFSVKKYHHTQPIIIISFSCTHALLFYIQS